MMVDDILLNMKSSLSTYIYIPLLDRNVGLEQRTISKWFQSLLILVNLGKMP